MIHNDKIDAAVACVQSHLDSPLPRAEALESAGLMKTYRVWYDNGAAVLVNANTADDAKAMALEQADRDGYPGLAVERVEDITA